MASPEKSKVRVNSGPKMQLYHHNAQPKCARDLKNPALPILKLVGRSSPQSQFWILCTVVFLLVIVYGFVFWDTMTQTPRFRIKSDNWEHARKRYDIHAENWQMRDDEGLLVHGHQGGRSRTNMVAIGCAVTSRSYRNLTLTNLQYRLPLLRTLLPSFCNTASAGYDYHFYVSFDVDDANLHRADILNGIYDQFQKVTRTLCPQAANVTLHFVQCSHSRNPAWAQNDAMMEAYLDDAEYYYRVNDDTLMLSPGWTESYIEALAGFDPAFVGVVGPVHKGGNEVILTYDFVHKTHVDIFGYYYPRLFTDWWADDWITAVYGSDRTVKLPGVRLKHTQEAGQRYKVQYNNGELVHYQIAYDRKILNRYIYSKRNAESGAKLASSSSGKKVISMSLWGSDPKYTFGAVRNAQLAPVYFPGWTLRVYVEETRENRPPRYEPTPKRIISKLVSLGAEIVYVDTDEVPTAPMLWRFLVADDMSLECFIVRDADARLQDRDAAAVSDWLRSNKPFHCVRDHPSHSAYSLSGGMWGARPELLRDVIPIPWKNLMIGYRGQYGSDMHFLSNMVWRKVQPVAYCHDSYSCMKWKGSYPFPVRRRGTEHIGQVFDAFGYARDIDMKIIRETPSPAECTVPNATYAEPNLPSDVVDAEVVNSAQLKQLEEDIEKRKVHQRLEMALKDSLLVQKEGENAERSTGATADRKNVSSPVLDAMPDERNSFRQRMGENASRQYVVWNMDYHIGSIRDIKYMLRSHKDVFFIDKSLAAKCHLTQTCATNLRVITKKNGMLLTPEVMKAFFEEYQDDPEMNLVTHFLCAYPPAMCELYLPFHKPIVVYITGRYEHGRYTPDRWESWNQVLQAIAREPRNTVIASNLYDAAYLNYYTGLTPPVIPPVCSYVQTQYAPVNPDILIAPVHNPSFYELFVGYMTSIVKRNRKSISVQYIPEAYPEYRFSDIASHPAVVHIPYQVSTYMFCEHYAMSIPIFVPSLHLLATWHRKYDVIGQLTWNRIRGLLGDTRSVRVHNTNMTNPNNLHEVTDIKQWLKLADFYQRPHIIYFDSVRDLVDKLTTTDLKQVSENMKHYNDNIGPLAEQKWSAVFQY